MMDNNLDIKCSRILTKIENSDIRNQTAILKEAFSLDIGDDSLIDACLSFIRNKSYIEGKNEGIDQKEKEIKELLYKKHIG